MLKRTLIAGKSLPLGGRRPTIAIARIAMAMAEPSIIGTPVGMGAPYVLDMASSEGRIRMGANWRGCRLFLRNDGQGSGTVLGALFEHLIASNMMKKDVDPAS